MTDPFSIEGKVCVLTGAAGFLGGPFAEALLEHGGRVGLLDLPGAALERRRGELSSRFGEEQVIALPCDLREEAQVDAACKAVIDRFGKVDVLINGASNNPALGADATLKRSFRVEQYPLDAWQEDLAVGLTGTLLCCKYFGDAMARKGSGVILNIASDLALISPDQRLYEIPGTPPEKQPLKPISYSVVKSGLLGLTRYLSTYWAKHGVRVNAVAFGGVENGQPEEFLERVGSRIPLGRLARQGEYNGTLLYLCSNASSYMTGAIVVVDGGRTVW